MVKDFEKAQKYHEAARDLSSEAGDRKPKFTDKEKINLEIYAERQTEPQNRERLMELARGSEDRSQERELAAVSRGVKKEERGTFVSPRIPILTL